MATAADLARQYFEAHGRRDVGALRALWDDEIVIDFTSQGILRGPEECAHYFEALYAAIPDAEMITDRVIGEGDDVAAVQWRLRGNFSGGPLPMGVDATGQWVDIRGCDVVEVREGRVTRITAYVDGMEIARSLGMLPPLDSGAEKAMIAAFNLATKARRALREQFG